MEFKEFEVIQHIIDDIPIYMKFLNEVAILSMLLYSGCGVVGLDRSTHYRYVQVDAKFSSSKALMHMLFHVLGRYHEHERADKEKYVVTFEKNIIEGIYSRHTQFCTCIYILVNASTFVVHWGILLC